MFDQLPNIGPEWIGFTHSKHHVALNPRDNSLLKNLNSVVEARFFKSEEPSLSRTLNFRISADQVEELERFYQEKLWPEMVKFDETAEGKEHKHVQLSVFWVVKDEPK